MMATASSRFMAYGTKLGVLMLLLCFSSCTKEEGVGVVPTIAFDSYERLYYADGRDSLLLIRFSFTDGDGDLGYTYSDTLPPFTIGSRYFYNLHADFFGLDNNGNKVFYIDAFSGDTIRFSQRIQTITPEGKYKSIKGVMELRVEYSLLLINAHEPKRIQLELWLNDRRLNESNRIKTPEIIVNL